MTFINIHNQRKVKGFQIKTIHLMQRSEDIPDWVEEHLVRGITRMNTYFKIKGQMPEKGGNMLGLGGSHEKTRWVKHTLKDTDWVMKSPTKGYFIMKHKDLIQNYKPCQ